MLRTRGGDDVLPVRAHSIHQAVLDDVGIPAGAYGTAGTGEVAPSERAQPAATARRAVKDVVKIAVLDEVAIAIEVQAHVAQPNSSFLNAQ